MCCKTEAAVIKSIKWSEKLDVIFKNNYKTDPRLSWQYFGSATGFMRQFPGNVNAYFVLFVIIIFLSYNLNLKYSMKR